MRVRNTAFTLTRVLLNHGPRTAVLYHGDSNRAPRPGRGDTPVCWWIAHTARAAAERPVTGTFHTPILQLWNFGWLGDKIPATQLPERPSVGGADQYTGTASAVVPTRLRKHLAASTRTARGAVTWREASSTDDAPLIASARGKIRRLFRQPTTVPTLHGRNAVLYSTVFWDSSFRHLVLGAPRLGW